MPELLLHNFGMVLKQCLHYLITHITRHGIRWEGDHDICTMTLQCYEQMESEHKMVSLSTGEDSEKPRNITNERNLNTRWFPSAQEKSLRNEWVMQKPEPA